MRLQTRKLVLVILTTLMVVLLLAASCSSEGTTTSATSPAVKTTATTPAITSTNTPAATATTSTAATTSAAATPTATDTPKSGGTLSFVYQFSPKANIGWPQDPNVGHVEFVTNFVFAEPLVFYKSDTSIEPWLAKSWELSSDNKTITFHLRTDVKFHDGTPFNAEAVKFNFDEAIKAKLSSATNWQSVDVIDEFTVRLNLKQFQNSLWEDLTTTASMIVSPTPAREKGIDYAREHPCGTGPFKFVDFVRDQYVKFERNPDYWQAGKPYLDKLEFLTVVDPMTQQSLLKSGEADLLGLVDGKTMSDLKQAGFLTQHDPGGTDFMSFDSANPDSIFSNIKVRQAMEYAINKQAIVDTLGHGAAYVNNQYPSPNLPFHDFSLPDRSYDLAKAKALLAEAGHPDGFKTKWIIPPWFGDAPLIVQESLKTIGVELTVEKVTDAKYWELARTGWKDAILAGSVAFSVNSAAGIKKNFPPYGSLHVSVKYPDNLKELVDDALAATDPAVQKDLNYKLVDALYNDSTFVFYVSNARGYVIAPYVHDGHWFEGAFYQYWSPSEIWLSK